jgi:hypothetical protein
MTARERRVSDFKRQRGLSLVWVTILSALVAAAAMAAIWSMRHERNLFAEGIDKVSSAAPVRQAIEAGKSVAGAGTQGGELRKCVIDGKAVVSNTDCLDGNRSSRRIDIHDTRGIEAPRAPKAPAPSEATSNPALDKIIEKQLN